MSIERKDVLTIDEKHKAFEEDASETIALLVLERGAEWPSWATGVRMRATNSAVEVQMDTETTAEFQKRVEARLAHIVGHGMRLVSAGFACALIPADRGSAIEEELRRFRKEVCTRILTHLADDPGAELILAGGSWDVAGAEGRQRTQLIELWGELSIQVPGRLMSVRFEDPPSESGVFRAAQNLQSLTPESSDFSDPPLAKAVLRTPPTPERKASKTAGDSSIS